MKNNAEITATFVLATGQCRGVCYDHLNNIQQLPQVGDGVVDAQVLRRGLFAGIEPAAGEPCVVGALDVRGQGVADDQRVFRCNLRDLAADVVVICFVGLSSPGFLRDKGGGKYIAK